MSNYPSNNPSERSNWDYPNNPTNPNPSNSNPFPNYQQNPSFSSQPFQGSPSFSDNTAPASSQVGATWVKNESGTPAADSEQTKTTLFQEAARQRKGVPIPFEEFIKKKSHAFFYFTQHPETEKELIQDDITNARRVLSNYNNALFGSLFGTAIAIYYADKLLQKSNLIYAMTHRRSIFKSLFKYWLIPTTVSGLLNRAFFSKQYLPQLDNIASKYDFEAPVFRAAYEKGKPPGVNTQPGQPFIRS